MFNFLRFASVTIVSSLYLAQPVLAESSGWELRSPTIGAPPCRAVKSGEAVNVQLLRNRNDDLVLIASRSDWEHGGGALQASLSIDDGEPLAIVGYPIGPVFLTLIGGENLERLKNAKSLNWSLPWGEYSAEVEGIEVAFSAIGVCPE